MAEVTPWRVNVPSGEGIDYLKLINRFGCDPIDGSLIKKFEQITKVKAHIWLRRGIFFSNKDLGRVLDQFAEGHPVYIYTGRGPSSESMHLGHLIPFIFTKYLQEAFNAIVIIQLSDDEKFAFKGSSEGKSIEYYNQLTYKNVIDIIACGFDVHKTYIFSNYRQMGRELYQNVVKINQMVNGNQLRGIYGLNLDNNLGELTWPAYQCAPAFSNSFPDILHRNGEYREFLDGSRDYVGPSINCLVPMAIDQDPYFRMARDFAEKYKEYGYLKPATIHSKFLVGLGGIHEKMSSSNQNIIPPLYLVDSLDLIKSKIMKYAFSGGQSTKLLHQTYGGNLSVDVAYQYLLFFMDSDEELMDIAQRYRSGRMMSSEIKKIMISVISKVIQQHQEKVSQVTPEIIRLFMTRDRPFNHDMTHRDNLELETDDQYSKYGINFDSTFGTSVQHFL